MLKKMKNTCKYKIAAILDIPLEYPPLGNLVYCKKEGIDEDNE